ncbi:hypothetical protein P5673_029124 [Acropora cervicornis]|uniref:Uncharacterized protein n=1 Tax=Acropora cervicornis TaxID=6130 RepID=A0AAD9UUB4_ACRCE|nr:hypothetical protein P5673_029124 [Acropora cervicornis]
MVFCEGCEMKVQEGGNITAITVGPEWNHFRMVRPSRHDTVGGVPDVLFQLPEESELESKCAYEEEENVFQEYFHYVMEEEGLQYPSNQEEALYLFSQLINIAQ